MDKYLAYMTKNLVSCSVAAMGSESSNSGMYYHNHWQNFWLILHNTSQFQVNSRSISCRPTCTEGLVLPSFAGVDAVTQGPPYHTREGTDTTASLPLVHHAIHSRATIEAVIRTLEILRLPVSAGLIWCGMKPGGGHDRVPRK